MIANSFTVRPIISDDKTWIIPLFIEEWGSVRMVSRGRLFKAADNPGFAAIKEGKPAGLITYEIINNQCEITTLNSLTEGKGIGTALIDAVRETAIKANCKRLWLITTNDNTHALRFYQKYGFIIAAVYPDSIRQSRLLKPEIPLTGNDGIPLRDEIEL
jgi:ribosomal protein S18 acetylase RimI-like enzyme